MEATRLAVNVSELKLLLLPGCVLRSRLTVSTLVEMKAKTAILFFSELYECVAFLYL